MQDPLKILRDQMASDFQVTWRILGSTASRVEEHGLKLEELARQMRALSRDTADGLRQAEGRMRSMERRFGHFLDVVEREMADKALATELEDLKARVEALERRSA